MRLEGSIGIPNGEMSELINPSHSLKLEASSVDYLGHYYIPSTGTRFNNILPDSSWQTSLTHGHHLSIN